MKTISMTRRAIFFGLVLKLGATAWAGMPVDLPVENPDDIPGRTIFVPVPFGGGGTNVASTNLPAVGSAVPLGGGGTNVASTNLPAFGAGVRVNVASNNLPAFGAAVRVENGNISITESWKKLMPAPQLKTDSLRLRDDGQEWSGTLTGWDGTMATWNMTAALCPTQVPCARVGMFALAPIGPTASHPPRWIVKLTNGDLLTGDRLTMDTNRVTLAFDGAGNLAIPRALVVSVQQDTAPDEERFQPLQRLDRWDRIVGQAVFTGDKCLVTNRYESGSYADLDLPDQVAIEFAVPSKATASLNIQMGIFVASPIEHLVNPGYSIAINGNNISCWMTDHFSVARIGERNEGFIGGSCDFQATRERDWVDIGLRINRQTGRLLVTVDGEIRRVFALEVLPAVGGRGMTVQCQQLGQDLPLRMLLTPLGDNLAKGTSARTEDSVVFANGAGVSGALESIGETNFVFFGSKECLNLPVERLCAARLAHATLKELPRRAGDAAIELRGGGQLTGALTMLSPTGAVVDVEWAGKVALPRAAVAGARWEMSASSVATPGPRN
jgi:hypothetical protein